MRILIVENDMTLHGLLQSILAEGDKNQVDACAGGEEALGRLERGYDVIVADGAMPGMSGPQFVVRAREWYRQHARPLPRMVGLSAHRDLRAEFEDLGLTAVAKPFSVSQLLAAVREGRT